MDRESKGEEREGNKKIQEIRKAAAEIEAKESAVDRSRSEYLSISEAAVFLNLKISKLRSMIFRKEIPFLKFGRLVRFRAQDLEDWVLTRRSTPPGFCRSTHDINNKSFFEIDTRFSKANSKGLP